MSTVMLVVAGFMVVLSVVYAAFKILVAYSHGDGSAGGAPLLDGYVFPPIFLGFGSAAFFRYFHLNISGLAVGITAFVVLFAVYGVARHMGARRRR